MSTTADAEQTCLSVLDVDNRELTFFADLPVPTRG
jgi:hypothetical protein